MTACDDKLLASLVADVLGVGGLEGAFDAVDCSSSFEGFKMSSGILMWNFYNDQRSYCVSDLVTVVRD